MSSCGTTQSPPCFRDRVRELRPVPQPRKRQLHFLPGQSGPGSHSLRNIAPPEGGGSSKNETLLPLKNQLKRLVLAFIGLLQATPVL